MTAEHSLPKEPFSKIRPSIYNEYSRLKQVLVVPTPEIITSFTDLAVNPIQADAIALKSGGIVERLGAAEKHGNLLTTFKNAGIELFYSRVKPVKEGHTPLFTRDVGVLIDDKVIPSRLRYSYRSVEVQGLLDVVDPQTIVHSDRDYMIEGGDIAILGKDLVLVGIGPRTNSEGLSLLRETFPKKEFIPVYPVIPEKAFHIDTVMGVLGYRLLVYLPELVPQELVGELKERGFSFVEANPMEYKTCCTNVLAIDNKKIISAAENLLTNRRIADAGVEVIELSLDGILSMGGGPHCLTLPLTRQP